MHFYYHLRPFVVSILLRNLDFITIWSLNAGTCGVNRLNWVCRLWFYIQRMPTLDVDVSVLWPLPLLLGLLKNISEFRRSWQVAIVLEIQVGDFFFDAFIIWIIIIFGSLIPIQIWILPVQIYVIVANPKVVQVLTKKLRGVFKVGVAWLHLGVLRFVCLVAHP